MDSLSKLISDLKRMEKSDHWDIDVKINMSISDVKYWCNEFLRINKNIEETSLTPSHETERKEKLLKDILS